MKNKNLGISSWVDEILLEEDKQNISSWVDEILLEEDRGDENHVSI